MVQREGAQYALAFGKEPYQHLAAIRLAAMPCRQPGTFESVDQLYRAVMFQLHAFSEHANGWMQVRREPLDREQQLVLFRFKPGRARSDFAEVQKTSDLVPELRQGSVIDVIGAFHIYIVTRYSMVPTDNGSEVFSGGRRGYSQLRLRHKVQRGQASEDESLYQAWQAFCRKTNLSPSTKLISEQIRMAAKLAGSS